jgi:hypothetical protein
MWMLHDLGVRFAVTPATVDTAAWPLVERARLREADGRERVVYELAWSPEVEARLGEPAAPVPPPPGPIPFAEGETLVYDVTWDGPAGALEAGQVTFAVEPATGGRYRLAVGARTAPWVARFFEADDRFTTTTDEALRPLLHERRIREGRRALDQRVVYDPAGRSAQPQHADGQPSGPPFRVWEDARDAVSALFYVRTLDLPAGSRATVPIVEGGQQSTLVLLPGADETVTAGGAAVAAQRIEARIEQRVQRRRMPEITLWIERGGARRLLAADIRAVFGNLRVRLR